MIPTQMLKGILEGCILGVIRSRETYGYEISQQLKQYGFSQIAEGTVYPLLLRLERSGAIQAQYRQSAMGPKRKYFYITPAGEAEYQQFRQSWKELSTAVTILIETEGRNQ